MANISRKTLGSSGERVECIGTARVGFRLQLNSRWHLHDSARNHHKTVQHQQQSATVSPDTMLGWWVTHGLQVPFFAHFPQRDACGLAEVPCLWCCLLVLELSSFQMPGIPLAASTSVDCESLSKPRKPLERVKAGLQQVPKASVLMEWEFFYKAIHKDMCVLSIVYSMLSCIKYVPRHIIYIWRTDIQKCIRKFLFKVPSWQIGRNYSHARPWVKHALKQRELDMTCQLST